LESSSRVHHNLAQERITEEEEKETEYKNEDHGRRTSWIESSSRQFSSLAQLTGQEALGVAQELEK
jgi:hypothetical protein